jgi:hypothetical protein
VTKLNLSGLNLTDAVAPALRGVLEAPTGRLEVLSLEQNDFREAGFVTIIEGLRTNTALRELRLDGQKMPTSKRAEETLAEALDSGAATKLSKLGLTIRNDAARRRVDASLFRATERARLQRSLSLRTGTSGRSGEVTPDDAPPAAEVKAPATAADPVASREATDAELHRRRGATSTAADPSSAAAAGATGAAVAASSAPTTELTRARSAELIRASTELRVAYEEARAEATMAQEKAARREEECGALEAQLQAMQLEAELAAQAVQAAEAQAGTLREELAATRAQLHAAQAATEAAAAETASAKKEAGRLVSELEKIELASGYGGSGGGSLAMAEKLRIEMAFEAKLEALEERLKKSTAELEAAKTELAQAQTEAVRAQLAAPNAAPNAALAQATTTTTTTAGGAAFASLPSVPASRPTTQPYAQPTRTGGAPAAARDQVRVPLAAVDTDESGEDSPPAARPIIRTLASAVPGVASRGPASGASSAGVPVRSLIMAREPLVAREPPSPGELSADSLELETLEDAPVAAPTPEPEPESEPEPAAAPQTALAPSAAPPSAAAPAPAPTSPHSKDDAFYLQRAREVKARREAAAASAAASAPATATAAAPVTTGLRSSLGLQGAESTLGIDDLSAGSEDDSAGKHDRDDTDDGW